jgi:SAM-dependent methyltransferase
MMAKMTSHDPQDLEWQRRYEQNDTPWDKGAPAPPLAKYLRENALAGRVLVPGCGKGRDVRLLGSQPNCFPVGLDLSPAAIDEAKRLSVQDGIDTPANFIVGDFFQLPPEMHGSFDWVVEHTCFCAINPALRPNYVLAAATALREGGKLFGIFYINPDTETGPPFAVTKEELSRLFDPHFTLLDEWVPAESFPGRENRELVRILRKR